MKRENWLEIDDYVYRCKNLDSDEKIIISVIMSFTRDGRKFYMSQIGLAETYGMTKGLVNKKFTQLKKLNLLIEDENGLRVDISELEYLIGIETKFRGTKPGGPGRKKTNNQNDTTNNQNDYKNNQNDYHTNNQNDYKNNQNDTTNNQNDYHTNNQNDYLNNQNDFKNNQNDLQLLKDYNKELQKEEITNDITKVISSDLGVSSETPKSNPTDDSFFDDIDLTEKYNYKPILIEEDKKDITNEELEDFLKELDI